MNAALLRFVLWRHRLAFIACWIVPVVIAVAVGLIYPTYVADREALTRALKLFSRFFSEDVVDMMSPVGFLLVPFQHPLTLLMLAMTAAVAPLALPAGDRGRGLLDVLLATPLSRRSLARTLLAVILLGGATFGWAPYLGVWIAASISGYAAEIPFDACAIVALNAGALVVALGTSALLCSATAEDGGSATTRFVGFVVVTLAIDVISRFWKAGRWLRWTSLLGYYHPHDLVGGRVSPWLSIGVLLGFSAIVYVVSERIIEVRRRA